MATKTVSGSTACPAYEVVLEDYLNGELSVAEALSAEEHWKTCAACRTALEQAAASMRLLRAAEKSAVPGPGFARVVMARVRTAEQERAAARTIFWQPFVSWGWKFAATAALALMGMLTYDAGWGKYSQPNADEVRPRLCMTFSILLRSRGRPLRTGMKY